MIILAIESSCDDSAVCIIKYTVNNDISINQNKITLNDIKRDEYQILSHYMYSQIKDHQIFKGVMPELASFLHTNKLKHLIQISLQKANIDINEIDCVAATAGPGLIGSLMVGTTYAKTLASILNKPYIAINHLEAHALSPMINSNLQAPYLLLLVSGGHSQFIIVEKIGKYKLLGKTYDDAVGECFDKVARLLGLEYPGGPAIEKAAINGNCKKFTFPIAAPEKLEHGCNMSFSGIKTFALNLTKKMTKEELDLNINNIAASFQDGIAQNLCYKANIAMDMYKKEIQIQKDQLNFVIAGGVASNEYIRNKLSELALNRGFNIFQPEKELCTDNAIMVAFTAAQYFKHNITHTLNFAPRSKWPLQELNEL
ncbi:MAG: tRNA (adenosine(37)-N6)-threonylcarbamoyltransferase complex transferase subunit TsaD [Rickettsiales bacterium]